MDPPELQGGIEAFPTSTSRRQVGSAAGGGIHGIVYRLLVVREQKWVNVTTEKYLCSLECNFPMSSATTWQLSHADIKAKWRNLGFIYLLHVAKGRQKSVSLTSTC